jgi:hypothetical protein
VRKIGHKQAVAYHEAGHAVVAALLGILRNDAIVTIASAVKGEHGSVSLSPMPWTEWSARYSRKAVLALYGGPAVTKRLFPGVDLFKEGGYYEGDMVFAERLLRSCAPGQWEWTGDPIFQSHNVKMWRRAVALVNLNWSAIAAVANELLKRKMIGADVKTIVARRRRLAGQGRSST